ncbi:MAG TPA: isoleucine--tRNA ligase [Verrucomicrobia bacterium]|nr:MAG: isoleucine--tRNA ligase [Lentisphaerae bacterium GWF2_57_35]HBA85396.1 isoleucine--tRNA ligase [Verrucomicrobiota bacterium]
MFEPASSKVNFPEMEREILKFWDLHKTFEKSLEQRRGGKEFVFYDGPPFATGLPHYGHLLAGTIKDIVPRYQAMRGYFVERRFGWDCHGLPVEFEMEQELKISGKRDIEKLGVDVFNEKCRSIVLRYTREWRQVVTRMGRWVDFDHDYKTMDLSYMESIWWVFKTLWDRNLIYEGNKILPYCPRCATPLSNFETNQGYAEVQDPAITVRFALDGRPNTYILAWTTTPWTLPSNMALAVGEKIAYVKIRDGVDEYYLAKDRLPVYYKNSSAYEVLEEVLGAALVGLKYEPLFPYFAAKKAEGAFRVAAADFVSTEDGTGVVHIAPGFGEDDYRLGLKEKLPAVCPVDDEGRFTQAVSDYAGREVKEADADIMRRLKQEGKLVHRSTINHSYPHCWRCDTALIYRAISTWFVRVEQFRDRIVEANKKIDWMPDHLQEGRFGKWIENARDWAISRNRYWGAPLPVWRNKDGEMMCVGSVEELEKLSGQKATDLHKHFVDKIEIPSAKGGAPLRRIPEVLDCWFESGAMPYAQSHYPFENKERFEAHFPADFIAEGLDQTRGWFYTLNVLSTALFDQPAFKNVVVNGLVLAEDGRKMSKRLKNYPDPSQIVDNFGADALRLYLIHSPVVRAENLCFSEEGVKHSLRHLLIPWWNAYSFFVTYARIDEWKPEDGKRKTEDGRGETDEVPNCKLQIANCKSPNLLDRWILSSLERLTQEVVGAMDRYDLQQAVRPFVQFVEELTNWYIRRSRRRFWKSSDDADKAQAYATLYHVLLTLSKIAAPFVPFMSEAIYRNLRTPDMPESVHLCDFPVTDGAGRDKDLEEQMSLAMAAVGMGRQLRADFNLKVRQPLLGLHVICRDETRLQRLMALQELIVDELNVRKIWFGRNETELADLSAKPNFSRLGPRLGSMVKKASQAIQKMTVDDMASLLDGKAVTLTVEGQPVEFEPEDIIIERKPKEGLAVASEGDLVVALEMNLTPELVQEGLAREFVNKVQTMRKEADLDVVQRIKLVVAGDKEVLSAIETHREYIAAETLSVECNPAETVPDGGVAWDLNGHACHILMKMVEK